MCNCWLKEYEKKLAPRKIYKSSVQDVSFFNKEILFAISNKENKR